MSKHVISLHIQLTSKPAVKSDPETTSPKKEIALKKDDAQKKDTSLKEDTLKDADEAVIIMFVTCLLNKILYLDLGFLIFNLNKIQIISNLAIRVESGTKSNTTCGG
jgi:hypothetical protein